MQSQLVRHYLKFFNHVKPYLTASKDATLDKPCVHLELSSVFM